MPPVGCARASQVSHAHPCTAMRLPCPGGAGQAYPGLTRGAAGVQGLQSERRSGGPSLREDAEQRVDGVDAAQSEESTRTYTYRYGSGNLARHF